jgi:FkbM family methyltransferase
MSRERALEYLCDAIDIKLPYCSFGKIDALDLWGFTEVMIFALYKHNRHRWKHVLDIGANIGLHSIIMAKLGWYVRAFEPDPETFKVLWANLKANNVLSHVAADEAAVHSTYGGMMNFVRVHNNLTGSHLEGYKDSYGPRNTIRVQTIDCREIWPKVDFAKIDSEGNEADLALTMSAEVMRHMSCVMEVRNEHNAEVIYDYFCGIGVPIWAQKVDWHQVQDRHEMPHINREGSIFVGHEPPW